MSSSSEAMRSAPSATPQRISTEDGGAVALLHELQRVTAVRRIPEPGPVHSRGVSRPLGSPRPWESATGVSSPDTTQARHSAT